MLPPDTVDFLEAGQSIHLATRNHANEPSGTRVVAARVDADRTHVTLFLLQRASATALENLRANGQAAACFGRPTDDHACQIKGTFVEERRVTDDDRQVIDAQRELLLRQLETIGIPRILVTGWPMWPCVAVRIKVTALFNQTPGPGAGAPLA
jgi:Pyridoxamine 5'-phosphate oxidase